MPLPHSDVTQPLRLPTRPGLCCRAPGPRRELRPDGDEIILGRMKRRAARNAGHGVREQHAGLCQDRPRGGQGFLMTHTRGDLVGSDSMGWTWGLKTGTSKSCS